MEYDHPRLIPTDTPSDTPEFNQECFDLKEGIDVHIDTWFNLATSESESTPGLLSKVIIAQCAPLEKPAEDILTSIRFQGNRSPGELRLLKKMIEHQNQLSEVAYDPSLDDAPIDWPIMARSFEFVRLTMENPNSSPVLVEALTYLRRLYARREELARMKDNHEVFEDAYKFSWILKKVIDEN